MRARRRCRSPSSGQTNAACGRPPLRNACSENYAILIALDVNKDAEYLTYKVPRRDVLPALSVSPSLIRLGCTQGGWRLGQLTENVKQFYPRSATSGATDMVVNLEVSLPPVGVKMIFKEAPHWRFVIDSLCRLHNVRDAVGTVACLQRHTAYGRDARLNQGLWLH